MGKVKLLFITLTISSQLTMAQWQQTDGPNGGYMQEIVQAGTTLVVSASNGGVYKSENNGDSWQLSSNGLPTNPSIQSLVENNGILYCSIYQNGVYKSEDNAETWESINSGIENLTFYSLLADGANLYAGDANGGIYYSNNGGESWSFSVGETSSIQFQAFETFNSKAYAGGSSLYESEDNGETWEEVEIPNLGLNGIRSMVADNGVFYAANDGLVFTSSDMVSWTQTSLNTSSTIVSMTAQGGRVYASASNGRYFYTDNGGGSWTLVQNTNTNSFARYVYSIGGKILMSTNEGLYESTDSGSSWIFASTGIKALPVTAIFGYNDTLFAGTDSQGIFRSRDNGDTWTRINNGLDGFNSFTIYEIIEVAGVLYIATGGGVYETLDEGDIWTRKLDPGINNSISVLDFDNDVFVAGPAEMGMGIYISVNGTDDWNTLTIDSLDEATSFESIVVEGNIIVLSTANGQIHISQDLGVSWDQVSISGGFYFTYDLELVNGVLYAGTARGLLVSGNLGEKWSFVINENIQIFDVDLVSDTIYAATNEGFYITANDRVIWYEFNDGMGRQSLNKLFFKGDEIFAGAFASSIWKLPVEEALLPNDDSDGDGVPDYRDSCLNTPPGVEVNNAGCDKVPANAILVYSETPTCPGVSNGRIEVATTLNDRTYNIEVLRGTNQSEFLNLSISDVYEIDNLASGNYLVTISIPDIQFEQTYGVNVDEFTNVSGKRQSIDRFNKIATYKVSGSLEYTATVNGEERDFTFNSSSENEIHLNNLKDHNLVSIKGTSDCQGIVSDSFAINDEFILYPIMTSGQVNVDGNYDSAQVRVFDFSGKLVLEKSVFRGESPSFNLNFLGAGVYPVQITSKEKTQTFKIIKR